MWCPKRRKPVLIDKVRSRLEEIIREVARNKGVEIIALEIKPDHLHLL
ncbi:MAG: transposase [Candidatus Omnitrophota bacterium]